jgi:hypothetical protein
VTCEGEGAIADCVESCTAAPDLSTDACEAAYQARNECVAALACSDYDAWNAGMPNPCSEEDSAIVDACAS